MDANHINDIDEPTFSSNFAFCTMVQCMGTNEAGFVVHQFNPLGTVGIHYTPYSTRISPENPRRLMGIYMEVLILGVIL